MVSQARLTQGRFQVSLRGWTGHYWRARVLQAGTLMLVHADHGALDPPSYLQCEQEEKRQIHPTSLDVERGFSGEFGAWLFMKEFSLTISPALVNADQ